MYRNACQRGLLTIFFGGGTKPLSIWDTHIQDGYVSRFLDQEIKSMVLEIGGTNISTTYMTCPKGKMILGIAMPFLVMVVKNLKKYFSFEVTVLDDTGTRRRFRVSNFQSSTQILPLCTVMPIALSDGWNQIQFNLSEFTRRAYKKQFVEVQRLKINANIRIRRIYFAERLLPEEQLPPEYKLFMPLPSKGAKPGKENLKPSTSVAVAPVVSKEKSVHELAPPGSKTSLHSVKKAPSVEEKTSKQSIKEQIAVARSVQAQRSGEELAVETVVEEGATEGGGEEGGDEAKPEETGESQPDDGTKPDEVADETAQDQPADQPEGQVEPPAEQPADQVVEEPGEQPADNTEQPAEEVA